MKARVFTFVVAGLTASVLATGPACSSSSGAEGVGDPCSPIMETDPTFLGFDEKEINVEQGAATCSSGICLINHFRGRVSCPYGQSTDGAAPSGATPCTTPNKSAPVSGNDPRLKAQVPAQCVDRSADNAVYCSCRCANANGGTNDGASYCACPNGFACLNVVSSIGPSTNDVAGSYCIKNGTAYDPDTACNQGDCDPVAKKCN